MQLHEVIWKDRFVDRNENIMSDKQKQVEPIPEEFGSYEEAADFWSGAGDVHAERAIGFIGPSEGRGEDHAGKENRRKN